MKREQFLITSTEGHNAVKYKWNSAKREVARLMQEYANANAPLLDPSVFEIVQNESEKDGFYHVSGVMTWKEKYTGKEISFFITKIA